MAATLTTNDVAKSAPFQSSTQTSAGVNVLVVGAGYAGLTAAIECRRKGHSVVVLEKFNELKILGDVISFGPNAGRIFLKWPGVVEKLDPICHQSDRLKFNDYTGDHIYTQVWADEPEYGKKVNGHRGEIHEVMWHHALEQGVEIRLGQNVTEYFEDDNQAAVISNGERISADVVLAADGVRSAARTIVLGYVDKPKSSGYAIFRSWFPSDDIAKDPSVSYLVNSGDKHEGWLGPDVHFLVATVKNGKDTSWVLTHKDEADVEESWSAPGKVEDAIKVVEGWDPRVHAIIRATPPDRLVDWKLVYRDPLPTWISPKSRIALIGDAAHPFLPTSIQGASQAMEDGATVAVCLELSGKANVQEAIQAYEKIRYDRVRAAQKTGETTRDKWHKADFDRIKQNPKAIKLPREEWLLNHDAEAHAYNVYADIVSRLKATTKSQL